MTGQTSDIIDLALAEDIRSGDITAKWFTLPEAVATADIVARESACLAGIQIAASVFQRIDSSLSVEIKKADGTALEEGDVVLTISGSAASILTANEPR
jgi:nicotinate-nucleotide pyrophosphorylase (carboxylating)